MREDAPHSPKASTLLQNTNEGILGRTCRLGVKLEGEEGGRDGDGDEGVHGALQQNMVTTST